MRLLPNNFIFKCQKLENGAIVKQNFNLTQRKFHYYFTRKQKKCLLKNNIILSNNNGKKIEIINGSHIETIELINKKPFFDHFKSLTCFNAFLHVCGTIFAIFFQFPIYIIPI